jgi:hypothetical protein
MTRPRHTLVPLAACLTLGSCAIPEKIVSTVQPAPPDAAATDPNTAVQASRGVSASDARRIQSQVMDFADDLTTRLAEAMDDIEERSPTLEGRVVAHRLKYTVAQGATIIAASTNPTIALVDMMVMISLQRNLLEKNIVPRYYGPEADRLRAVFESAEREIRALTARSLTAEQIAEIDTLIARWLEENPDRRFAAYVRLSDFAAARQAAVQTQAGGRASNVLGLLFIDPLSGLDPTTRELEQTRLFAERAFFYLQRMPVLISWQAELLYIDTVSEPEVRAVLDDVTGVSASIARITEEIAAVRTELPETIAAERAAAIDQMAGVIDEQRQAAIEQALAGLRAEREAMIEQLAGEQERLGTVVADLRGAIEATTALSESVQQTTAAFSDLATQLRLDQPGDPDDEPFRIRDYTEAMHETTAAAAELARLTESLSAATEPELLEARLRTVEARLAEAETSANRLLDRAFRLTLILVIVLVVGLGAVVGLAGLLRARAGRG